MILVLRPDATADETDEVLRELARRGCEGTVVRAGRSSVVHVTRGRTRRARKLRRLEQVIEVVPTSGPRIRREGWRFFPYHFVTWSAAGVALLGVLVFLAGMWPTGIGDEVDYGRPPATVSQPWYLRPAFALVDVLPDGAVWLGWGLLATAALAFLTLPLLERTRLTSRAGRALPLGAAVLLVLYLGIAVWQGVSS